MRRLLAGLLFLFLGALPCEAANRFAVCTVTCTWDGASTAMWSTSTGGATGASVPGVNDAVVLDAATCVGGVTCTVTVNTTVTVQSITGGTCTAATTGCILDFSVNNNNVTLSQTAGLSYSGTGTRTLRLGNGTWTLSGATVSWTLTTTTNLTFAANSSTLAFTSAVPSLTRTFNSGGLTYNIVTIAAVSSTDNAFAISGGPTIATLNITGLENVVISSGTTLTATNLNITGTSTAPVAFFSTAVGTAANVAVTTATMTWVAFRTLAFTGSPVASNSLNLGGNSGITITAPSGGTAQPVIIGG